MGRGVCLSKKAARMAERSGASVNNVALPRCLHRDPALQRAFSFACGAIHLAALGGVQGVSKWGFLGNPISYIGGILFPLYPP